ncbi:MAG TPA: hypothetical protein VNT26_13215, partial [Candidatus Sulfotelmatobacter sp.]|nr:hypothetical protein [Candidatus Sulfotelmatobacter sp.]
MSNFYVGKFVTGEKSWQLLATKRMLIYSMKKQEVFAVATFAEAKIHLKEDDGNRLILWENGEWKKIDLIIEERPMKAGFA